MPRFPILLFLCCGLLLLLSGCRREAGATARPAPSRTLVFGTDATYPPFEFREGNRIVGFDVELGNLIAAELGARARWVNSAFDGIFPALHTGKFDLVMSSVTITPERQKQLAFSDGYYTAGQIVAVRQDEPEIQSLDDLGGKVAGIQSNTTAEEVLKSRSGVEVRRYESIDLALQDLTNGNLRAVVGDAPTLRYFIKRGFPRLKTVGDLLSEEHYGIAMRPKDAVLRQEVNAALARIRADGRYAALEQKWFGTEAETVRNPWAVILPALAEGLWLTVQLTCLALLIGLPLGLTIALLRQVRFPPLAWLCATYVELFRGTPLLFQVIFIYYALPPLLGINLPQFAAGVLALSLNSAAYIAEIFRSGIQSIDTGQMEAARSLGMPYGMAMQNVILPQAFRRVLPPLTNETIALLKDSSLVSVIGMVELTQMGRALSSQLALPLMIWPAVALFYLAVTFPLTRLAGMLERKWSVKK